MAMKGLATDPDALFDEYSFLNINSAEQANSALRWFSSQASRFHTDLIRRNYDHAQIELWMDTLWKRIIEACRKYEVPLTSSAEAQANRLGL